MVESLERQPDGAWRLKTDIGQEFEAKLVVISAGGGSFMPKKPPIEGIADYEGTSVFYSVRDMKRFTGQDLVIVGGGDSALDWTMALEPLAKSVTLVHRRDQFRAHADTVNKVMALREEGRINFVMGQVASLQGADGQLSGLSIKPKEGDNVDVACDALLPFFGLTMKLGPIANFGLNLHENLIPVDTEKFQTSEPGIFAVGDINYYPGKLKLILSGFHEAALMAREAFRICYPDGKLKFEYTTSSSNLQKKLAA